MVMKKFINDPDNLAAELLEGFALAYGDKVKLESGKLVVRARPKPQDKVALVTLGGAGREPALAGSSAKACWTSAWWATSSPPPAPRRCWRP